MRQEYASTDVSFIGSVEQNGLTAEARLVRFRVCSKEGANHNAELVLLSC